MKHIFTLLFLSIFVGAAAQTITQSFNEPVVGDVDRNYRLDTSAFTTGMPSGVSGNNCTWDFSNIKGIFPMIVDSFLAPAAVMSSSAYPSATYVQHRDIYTFYKSTSSPQQTELLGGYTASLSLIFSNTAIIANYPLNYGYNLSDPVSGTFKYNTTNGACIGNINISADGLGTLKMPYGITLQNVLRLKSVEILTLSVAFGQFGTFNQTIYNYYMPGKKFPVLNVNYSIYQFIAGTPTITAFVYGSNDYFNPVGLDENSPDYNDFSVYPNPFNDHLQITSNHSAEENIYSIYNVNGILVSETTSPDGLETGKLSAGIYFLQIRNKRGTLHRKIIKE